MNNGYLSPKEVAYAWVDIGRNKVNYTPKNVFFLALLGGFFVGLGAHGFLVVTQSLSTIDVGFAKFMGAAVFPVGIMLVVLAGGELFTGNTLIASAWANKEIRFGQYFRNLSLVYFGNLVGSLLLVYMLYQANLYTGHLAEKAIAVAEVKVSLTFYEAFLRGILCNVLVAIAVYMQVASKEVIGKIFALWFPVMLFVLSGYEHSVANMVFIPLGAALGGDIDLVQAIMNNFIPVTLGNIVGGSGFIALLYWNIHVKGN